MDIKSIGEAIGLLNCMIECGERHSEVSKKMISRALFELDNSPYTIISKLEKDFPNHIFKIIVSSSNHCGIIIDGEKTTIKYSRTPNENEIEHFYSALTDSLYAIIKNEVITYLEMHNK